MKIHKFDYFSDHTLMETTRIDSYECFNKMNRDKFDRYPGNKILSLSSILESDEKDKNKNGEQTTYQGGTLPPVNIVANRIDPPNTSAKVDNTYTNIPLSQDFVAKGPTPEQLEQLRKQSIQDTIQKIAGSPYFLQNFPNYNLLEKDGDKKLFWLALLRDPLGLPYEIMLKATNPLEKAALTRAMDERNRPKSLSEISRHVIGTVTDEENIDLAISIIGWGLGVWPETKPIGKGVSYLHTASFAVRAMKAWKEGNLQRGMVMGIKFIVDLIWCFKDVAIEKLTKGIPAGKIGDSVKIYLEKHKHLKSKTVWHNLINWIATSKGVKSIGLDAMVDTIFRVGLIGIEKLIRFLLLGMTLVTQIFQNEKCSKILNGVGLQAENFKNIEGELKETADMCRELSVSSKE
jgi:hypothetical protein